ncbi:hypothetical protein [Deinococcus altitudinis]|uniref:hypothetical protein n=1 Tax=Deinococcus altitudinis TaxID=468914 RepID=UPI003891F520
MNHTTRTFTAAYPIFLDDAVIAQAAHTITATGYGSALTFTLDGQPATLQQVTDVRALAESRGQCVRVSGPSLEAVATLSKRTAQALHLDLSRLGYTHGAHYEVASAAVNRDLVSLTELTPLEAARVWVHACLVRGFSTPVTRYYGQAAA